MTYNNVKNASSNYTPFELNYGHHLQVFYEEDGNSHFKSKSIDELLLKLQDLMTVYWENFYHAQKFQKQIHNKAIKPKSYAFSNKVWLNRKYLKTKQNQKLKAIFFRPFWALHLVGKQAWKLELPRKWRIYNVFHMLLLKYHTTKKKRVDENMAQL